ncbi:hypothetical protein Btru_002273 [Bulinus truncatus]|nr:hypothetical protein Btru_002273 [Bulinus truncatus]
MEYSSLYTRRLSGSYSSRNSFNEDALEQLEFNINDISRASSPASVISISAKSEGFRERRHRSSGRYDDEYRKKYSIVRGELEQEKIKSRQLHLEKEEEIRKMRELLENERKLAVVAVQNRLEEEKKRELTKLKEELIKQKEFELQQVLMYREAERKHHHSQKPGENKRGRKEELKTEEKEKNEAEEEDEQVGLKDGDNDVAVIGEKGRLKEGGKEEKRRLRLGGDKQLVEEEPRAPAVGPKEGGTLNEHKRTPRTPRSHRISDGYLADKESGSSHRSRRGHNAASKLTEKTDNRRDAPNLTEPTEMMPETASDNNSVKSASASAATILTHANDAAVPVKETNNNTDVNHQSLPSKEFKDSGTDTAEIPDENAKSLKQEKEKNSELELRLKTLEIEHNALQKQREDIQRSLDTKSKEYKIREEDFARMKEGYELNLRNVINEHKKVALVNLEKLKLAETALKASTMSDDEIALISQQHSQRRMSLPGLDDEAEIVVQEDDGKWLVSWNKTNNNLQQSAAVCDSNMAGLFLESDGSQTVALVPTVIEVTYGMGDGLTASTRGQ